MLTCNIKQDIFVKQLQKKRWQLNDAQRKVVENTARMAEVYLKQILSVPGGIGPDGKTIRSAPGQPPRLQSGRLQANAGTKVHYSGNKIKFAAFVNHVPYAAHLEFGTAKMAARPFLRPTLNKCLELFKGSFRKIGRSFL